MPVTEPTCTASMDGDALSAASASIGSPKPMCAACNSSKLKLTTSRSGCLMCILAHAGECGGLGEWRSWAVPRTLGALCGADMACNTCRACCEAAWVLPSGASCIECEANECHSAGNHIYSSPQKGQHGSGANAEGGNRGISSTRNDRVRVVSEQLLPGEEMDGDRLSWLWGARNAHNQDEPRYPRQNHGIYPLAGSVPVSTRHNRA